MKIKTLTKNYISILQILAIAKLPNDSQDGKLSKHLSKRAMGGLKVLLLGCYIIYLFIFYGNFRLANQNEVSENFQRIYYRQITNHKKWQLRVTIISKS